MRHFTRKVLLSLILILLGIVDDCAERKGGKFRVEFLDRRELLQNPSSRDSSLEPLGFERGVGVVSLLHSNPAFVWACTVPLKNGGWKIKKVTLWLRMCRERSVCNSASDCLICCMKNIRGKVRALLTSYFHSHSSNDQAGSEHRHRPLVFVPHPLANVSPQARSILRERNDFGNCGLTLFSCLSAWFVSIGRGGLKKKVMVGGEGRCKPF